MGHTCVPTREALKRSKRGARPRTHGATSPARSEVAPEPCSSGHNRSAAERARLVVSLAILVCAEWDTTRAVVREVITNVFLVHARGLALQRHVAGSVCASSAAQNSSRSTVGGRLHVTHTLSLCRQRRHQQQHVDARNARRPGRARTGQWPDHPGRSFRASGDCGRGRRRRELRSVRGLLCDRGAGACRLAHMIDRTGT